MVLEMSGRFSRYSAGIVAAVGLSASCQKEGSQTAWWQSERERIELDQELALKKFRLEKLALNDFKQLEVLRTKNVESSASLQSLRTQRLTLGQECDSLEASRSTFRETVIHDQRQQAIGRHFEMLDLASGRKFQQVTVTAINDGGVTIRHAHGSARLHYADLDAKQRLIFGLEADLALAAEEKESKASVAYEQWIENRVTTIHENEVKASALAKREERNAARDYSQLVARQAAVAKTRPLGQAPTVVGSGSRYGYYSSYRVSRLDYYNPYYYNAQVSQAYPQPCYRAATQYPRPVAKDTSFANTTIPSIP